MLDKPNNNKRTTTQQQTKTKQKGSFTPNAMKEGQERSGFVNYPKSFVLEDGMHKRRAEDIILISALSQLVVGHCFCPGMHKSLKEVKNKF